MVGEKQGLALKTVMALGAEMPCVFEGKSRLCPRLLLMAACLLTQGGGSCRASRAEAWMTFKAQAITLLTCAWVESSSGTFPVPVSHQAWAS